MSVRKSSWMFDKGQIIFSNLNTVVRSNEKLCIWIFQAAIQDPLEDHQVERFADCGEQLLNGVGHLQVAVVQEAVEAGNEGAAAHLAAGLNDCGKEFQSAKNSELLLR